MPNMFVFCSPLLLVGVNINTLIPLLPGSGGRSMSRSLISSEIMDPVENLDMADPILSINHLYVLDTLRSKKYYVALMYCTEKGKDGEGKCNAQSQCTTFELNWATHTGWLCCEPGGWRGQFCRRLFLSESIWRQSIRNKCRLGSTWTHSAPLSYYPHPTEIHK